MTDLLADLNPSQQEAVTYCDGPQMVIAGAGSGKTRVLTYKIVYLLQQGLMPWNILALTFTNKAAREMKERIGQLVGHDTAKRLNMGTFHSVFLRILHRECSLIGYQPNFTIYDENDSRSLLKTIIREWGLDDNIYKPATVHARISQAKNRLISAIGYAQSSAFLERDRLDRMPRMADLYTAYEQRCRAANAMDFDDLLVQTFRLFNDHMDVRDKYQEQFAYVLVDEYQDTNYAQQRIVEYLTERRRKICVVGDDAQSIYAFRGANLDNMLHFDRSFGEFRTFKLEQNYRSTQNIVDAANSLIANNRNQLKKNIFSKNEKGDKVVFRQAYSDKEEAALVVKDIRRLRKEEHCSYDDFCILYRTNAQSRNFEDELRLQALPYRIFGGLSFYQRKEIKDIIAYFRLVINPDDDEAFRRIINYPARGIGQTTMARLQEAASRSRVSLWRVAESPEVYGMTATRGVAGKLKAFADMIEEFAADSQTVDACELGNRILNKSGLLADVKADNSIEGRSRQENVGEFCSSLRAFVDNKREEDGENEIFLEHFIQETSLLTDQDMRQQESPDGRISLMTIHASKGLEFPTVFVVGMEENLFPSQRSLLSMRELEEERRLLYVAITRAERHCILSCARNRYLYGQMSFNDPSRFIYEIDSRFLASNTERTSRPRPTFGQQESRASFKASRPQTPKLFSHQTVRPSSPVTSSSPSAAAPLPSGLKEGSIIEHQRFGLGTVLKIEGTGENTKATVVFKNIGTKQLLLKFARFTIVG